MSSSQRRGFTLVELMLVLAIVAVLVGIGATAVTHVREAGTRISCSNNLKQLVLAAHNIHSTHGYLPTNPDTLDKRHGTLQDLLQPYLE